MRRGGGGGGGGPGFADRCGSTKYEYELRPGHTEKTRNEERETRNEKRETRNEKSDVAVTPPPRNEKRETAP